MVTGFNSNVQLFLQKSGIPTINFNIEARGINFIDENNVALYLVIGGDVNFFSASSGS